MQQLPCTVNGSKHRWRIRVRQESSRLNPTHPKCERKRRRRHQLSQLSDRARCGSKRKRKKQRKRKEAEREGRKAQQQQQQLHTHPARLASRGCTADLKKASCEKERERERARESADFEQQTKLATTGNTRPESFAKHPEKKRLSNGRFLSKLNAIGCCYIRTIAVTAA